LEFCEELLINSALDNVISVSCQP